MNLAKPKFRSKRPDIILCCSNRVALCVELKFGTGREKTAEYGIAQMLVNKYVTGHPEIKQMAENGRLDRIVAMGVSGKEKKKARSDKGKTMEVRIKVEIEHRNAGANEDGFGLLNRFEEGMMKKYRKVVDQFKKDKENKKNK